ncbi:hypothetical protein QR685DRAFT_515004 [Neurospora intermedia]|uniref:Uncharacterized protein n=1 Tax=Neurospora intermedia TaxID=5142 RepID=A0ABR3DJ88_NEUIN
MDFDPPQTPQRARPSRFIYPPEVHRSRESKSPCSSEQCPLSFTLFSTFEVHSWTRPLSFIF